jgi:hypothetical protein
VATAGGDGRRQQGDAAGTAVLTATFRRADGRDEVRVARSDGSHLGWDFPSYGDVLPHDLVHVVVEGELGLTDGFWGLVDGGADVVVVGDRALLARGGVPLTEIPGQDLGGLVRAEEAVALLGPRPRLDEVGALAVARLDPGSFERAGNAFPATAEDLGFQLPATATPAAVVAVRERLAVLARRWRDPAGGDLTVTWAAPR